MLREENRLARREFRRAEKILQPGIVAARFVARLPLGEVRQHKIVAFNPFVHNWCPRFFEATLPYRLAIVERNNQLAVRLFVRIRIDDGFDPTVGVASRIMVAVVHEILHLATVCTTPIRENLEPRFRRALKLIRQPPVGNISAAHHAINTALVKVPQRFLECRGGALINYVNIRKQSNLEIRLLLARHSPDRRTCTGQGRSPDKSSSA